MLKSCYLFAFSKSNKTKKPPHMGGFK